MTGIYLNKLKSPFAKLGACCLTICALCQCVMSESCVNRRKHDMITTVML